MTDAATRQKARELGTIAYNLGHPNTPLAFSGVIDLIGFGNHITGPRGRAVVAEFEAAWEDNAQHDRDRAAGRPVDPAVLLAEYDAWAADRADLTARDCMPPSLDHMPPSSSEWEGSDNQAADLATRLADALRAHTAA